MKIQPAKILPSQDFLKVDTIKFILKCIENNELNKLPPPPIVRKDNRGRFVAIDGHNLIAVKLQRHEMIDVHVAQSANDGLPETSKPNIQRNQDLKDKFDSVLLEKTRLQASRLNSFHDLLASCDYLF